VPNFKTESTTEIVSGTGILGVAVGLFIMSGILGGGITLLPGTSHAISIEPFAPMIFGGGFLLTWAYNRQKITELEAVDGILGVLGLGILFAWFLFPTFQMALSAYEPWAGVVVGLLGWVGAWIFAFGDDGGLLG